MEQEAASNLLVSGFMRQFSHRMNIRCFLTGFFGQEDVPSELLQLFSIITKKQLTNGSNKTKISKKNSYKSTMNWKRG